MITPSDISAKSTHDLWVDARQFTITISRPTPTTIKLDIQRPMMLEVTDGAVVLLSNKPISTSNHPRDGFQYTANLNPDNNPSWFDWPIDPGVGVNDPQNSIGSAKVVGAYYGILNQPFPETESTEANATVSGFPASFRTFSIIIEDTNPTTIYYASVHAASNVLQYYPLGVQSYALDAASAHKSPGAYTGNIPSYSSAPTAPTPGMVYHDQALNIIQYFDNDSGAWIPTRSDSIVSGAYNPGILGQVYLYAANQMKLFNGKVWVDITSSIIPPLNPWVVGDPVLPPIFQSNLKVRASAMPGLPAFMPFSRMTAGTVTPTAPYIGEFFYDFVIERLHYWDGFSWVYPNSTNTLFLNGVSEVPAFVTPITIESELLRAPYVGQLFYNTTSQHLNAWNGAAWNKVNTDQEGVTSSDKVSIGKDGSYDERIRLIKVLNSQMGWPQLCVELQEEQFNIAIDNALDNYRQLSSGAYRRGFVLYKLIPGQQKYYLNSAIDKTDHIVDIHKIHRMGSLGVHGGGPNDVWAHAFAQQFYNLAAGGGSILSTHLVAAYGEELNRLFAGDLMYQWDEQSHELLITRAIRGYETVVIEAMLERSEQELLQDRWCKQYIQNWSLAELKMTLGLIRSKFASGTPGPGGTINLNGELLVSEARQDMVQLKEELLNYEYGGHIGMGNVSFLIG